jgi:FkbM family methyltransferase
MASPVSRAIAKLASFRLVDSRRLAILPERMHLRRLLSWLDVDCVFDVGANTGQYATMLRRNAGYRGRIISFEPIPEAAEQVRRKAAGDKAWTLEQLALAESAGRRTFNVMAGSEFSSLSQPKSDEVGLFSELNRPVRAITVETQTLDQAFRRLQDQFGFRRPFLKMDTQGFDLSVLQGAQACLQQFVGFQSELSIKRIYEQATDFRDALRVYEGLGFDLSAFVPNNGGHFPALIEMDCILVRRDLMSASLRAKEHASPKQGPATSAKAKAAHAH